MSPRAISSPSKRSVRLAAAWIGSLAVLLFPALSALGQALSPAERATMLLTTAKSAFNDGNYAVATDRFREYLRIGSGSRMEMASARYGLGVSLIEGSRDYKNAAELLGTPAQIAAFKDRAFAAYYLGVAYRGLGDEAYQSATTRPAASQPTIRNFGDQNFRYSAQNFGVAADGFIEKAAAEKIVAGPEAKELPAELEWIARARCDQAEMLIRCARYKEAWVAADAIANGDKFEKSRYRGQAAYYLGYAAFGLKDYPVAVRALATLAPFEQDGFGVHARYLLARTHHLADERPEAMADYQALIAVWDRQRHEAQAKIADKATPAVEKEKLIALASGPAPEYVARAMFYWGVVLAEFGQAEEALPKFMRSIELSPESPVADEARLRAGMAGVQVKKYPEALKALAPLREDPKYSDQALRWLAKAQYGQGAVPVPLGRGVAAIMNAVPDPAALAAGIRKSAETLKLADERAKAAALIDPQAGARRAVILLEFGDMLQLAQRYKDAAAVYAAIPQVRQASLEIAEQGLLRQAVALQLGGQYADSDKACAAFAANYPRSALRPEAMVRYGENALLVAFAAKDAAAANTDGSKRPYSEAIARFDRVLNKYPETPQANIARFGLATVMYLQNQFEPAVAMLNKIPESERSDELAGVSLLLADCQLRALPETADDAITGARVAAQLETILTQLDNFVAARPKDPEAADAMIRIGYAANKLASLLADPQEKRRTTARARRAYAGVVSQFPDHPLYPVALLENAKLLAAYGSASPAVMELSKFQADPLNKTGIAPLAMIHLADAMRTRRKPDEAVALLRQVRAQHEAELLKDPAKAMWVPVMQYSLALSLKESGKYGEARELFQKIAMDYPKRPEAIEAVWRIAQCEMDPVMSEVESKRRVLAVSSKPEVQQEIFTGLLESIKALRTAADQMTKQAAILAAKETESEVPQKMNYDAAWCYRVIGEVEVEGARRAMQAEAVRKIMEKQAAEDPTAPPVQVRPPEILAAQIPVQPGEKISRERYRAVIDGAVSDSPLVDEARVELADLLAGREEHNAAIALFAEAISKTTNADLGDRLRVRMASLQLSRGDAKAALATVNEILSSQRTVYAGYASLIAVEASYQTKDWAGTVERAKPFVDLRPYGRIPGVADHALLRMAHAQQQLGQWAESKQTLDMWLVRFNGVSLMTHEAKYAVGLAQENMKEFDKAAATFAEVAARNGGEIGAKANLQAGLMRMEQKQYAEALTPLMTVAYGYDYPELNPAAMCEGAKALAQLGKTAEAKKLLQRALREYPSGKWAAQAKLQMEGLK